MINQMLLQSAVQQPCSKRSLSSGMVIHAPYACLCYPNHSGTGNQSPAYWVKQKGHSFIFHNSTGSSQYHDLRNVSLLFMILIKCNNNLLGLKEMTHTNPHTFLFLCHLWWGSWLRCYIIVACILTVTVYNSNIGLFLVLIPFFLHFLVPQASLCVAEYWLPHLVPFQCRFMPDQQQAHAECTPKFSLWKTVQSKAC